MARETSDTSNNNASQAVLCLRYKQTTPSAVRRGILNQMEGQVSQRKGSDS